MSKRETGKIEYHYGFYGAVHVQYEAHKDILTYLQEHQLGEEPVRMDMLLIQQTGKKRLQDRIGGFFRTYNVLEYKSPNDGLTIDDFYKAQGYALLYKGLGKTVNEIPLNEITVTIFRHSYPREMLTELKREGLTVENPHPGVYYVTGALSVPTQIIVSSRLPAGEYEAFKILAGKARKQDILQVLDEAGSNQNPSFQEYLRSVLKVSMAANPEIYREIREEGQMKDVFNDLFREELEEKKEEGRKEGMEEGRKEGIAEGRRAGIAEGESSSILRSIQNLMETMKLTAQQAMIALRVPEDQQAGYAAKLNS